MRSQIGAIVVAACLAGCGTTAVSHTESAASCVGPTLTLSAKAASPGATVSANGEWFAADCYDTGQPGLPPPLTGLTVSVLQGGRTWHVATGVNAAGDHFTFHVPVVLPSELQPGAAIVRVDGSSAAAKLHIKQSS